MLTAHTAKCLLVFLFIVHTKVRGDYDENFCREYYLDEYPEGSQVPYFYDDYAVTSEKLFLKAPNNEDLFYLTETGFSSADKQVLVKEESLHVSYFFFVDERLQECVYEVSDYGCIAMEETCPFLTSVASYLTEDMEGRIIVGTSSASMGWPTDIQHQVYGKNFQTRSIKCEGYFTCSYNKDVDETVASEWYVLSTSDYPQMDRTKPVLITAIHHRQRDGSLYSEERIDYTNYKTLSDRIQIPESACASIQSSSSMRELPKPPSRFSFSVDVLEKDATTIEMVYSTQKYDYETRIISYTITSISEDTRSKIQLFVVSDYSAGYDYILNLDSNYCEVYQTNETTMKTPEEFWGFYDTASVTYMGEYSNREIPVGSWSVEYSDDTVYDEGTVLKIDLATVEWLVQQGYSSGEFYPVESRVPLTDREIYNSIVEFKSNPPYDVPDVTSCYDSSDILALSVTLLADYSTAVAPDVPAFELEFRKLILSITGIVSSLRVQNIKFTDLGDGETRARFEIMGKLNVYSPSAYNPDPVTSQEAADKIEAAVGAGSATFRLDKQQITVSFKTGSYKIEYGDEAVSGYSSGSMWAIGICLLLIGLALGVGAIFVYIRFFKRSDPSITVSFTNLEYKS